MWMNLDQLPAGKSMYTIAVTDQPLDTPADEIAYDEIDVVTSSRATAQEVVAAAKDELEEYEGVRVIGVSNQSAGYVLWQDPNGDLQ